MVEKYIVSPSPHIRGGESVDKIMRDVIIALIPAMMASIYFFRFYAVFTLSLSVFTAVVSEMILNKLMKKEISIYDGSAVITGILFAFVIPPQLPFWQVIIGSSISIILGKMVFGGLGHNIFNPALIGRAFLMASWPVAMTSWIIPEKITGIKGIDAAVGATPLGILKIEGYGKVVEYFGNDKGKMYVDLFLGNIGGSLGETSAVALILGAVWLFYRKIISWHIPIFYIGTVFILMAFFRQDPLFHVLAGGLILGAFFMATDMVTTPTSVKGKIVFGIGAGILVVWIRLKGGYPEGVCYSILIMNAFTPIIERYTKPRLFGEGKSK